MATLEIEGAESGWLASVALGPDDLPYLHTAARAELVPDLGSLVQRLLEEPYEGGLLGARRGEALLYALADAIGRRRPLLEGERVFAHVRGGSRAEPSAPVPPGWDEP